MNVSVVLRILANILSVYAFLCFIRIIITWIPALSYSRIARILSAICDPFLNRFRSIRWLQFGGFDFSPALAICLLGIVSSILAGMANAMHITLALVVAMVLNGLWSVIFSFINFIILLLIIRLVMIFVNGNEYTTNPIMEYFDRAITPLVFRIATTFHGKKRVSYKHGLIVAIIALAIANVIGLLFVTRIIGIIAALLSHLPF